MALPIVLRAAQLVPAAARYFRRAPKFMGKAEVVPPKALPAPKGAVNAGKYSSVRTALGNTAKIAPAAIAASAVPEPKQTTNSNSGATIGSIDLRKIKPSNTPLTANDVGVAARAMNAPKQAPKAVKNISKGKVASVQTGGGNASSKFSVSEGTSRVGLKADAAPEGLKIPQATVQTFGDAKGVQGTGNMDVPQEADDANFGMSEDQLKQVGLDESNKEIAAKGGGSLWQRLKDGNIDQAGSAAYNKYGAGYGREVMKRRQAAQRQN